MVKGLRVARAAFFLISLWSAAFVFPDLSPAIDAGGEIEGLLINQSKTRTGAEFFQQFAALWDSHSGGANYNIVVIENATPQWGSIIMVKLNEVVVYRANLKYKNTEIRAAAEQAITAVRQHILMNVLKGSGGAEPDLSGSGL